MEIFSRWNFFLRWRLLYSRCRGSSPIFGRASIMNSQHAFPTDGLSPFLHLTGTTRRGKIKLRGTSRCEDVMIITSTGSVFYVTVRHQDVANAVYNDKSAWRTTTGGAERRALSSSGRHYRGRQLITGVRHRQDTPGVDLKTHPRIMLLKFNSC